MLEADPDKRPSDANALLEIVVRESEDDAMSLSHGAVGRWLSKYVLFPFGGAFLAVEFAEYLGHELGKLYRFIRGLLPMPEGDEPVTNW